MRAAIYTRISYDKTGETLGVQRQEKVCREILDRQGWELVEVYSDNDISAFDHRAHRPAYERLVRDYAAGGVDALVAWDLDRLTRQPRQLEDWIDAAERRGFALVTFEDSIDLRTVGGRMYARIKAAVARSESEQKRARQEAAGRQRAELGRPWGPRRPFGFAADKVTHHPVEADVVRRMYADYITGTGQREIVRSLQAQGVLTTLGKQWTQPVLRNFLRSPRNAGLSSYRGEVVGPAVWEPLVDRATWETAVAMMDRQAAGRTPGGAAKHLLVGIARCGVCGGPMGTSYSPSGVRQYACRAGSHVIRRGDMVDGLVVAVVVGMIRRDGIAAAPQRGDGVDRGALVGEQEVLLRRQEQLGAEWALGAMTDSQLRSANTAINTRLQEISGVLASSEDAATLRPLLGVGDVQAAWDSLDLARRRAIVSALVVVEVLPAVKGYVFDPERVRVRPRRDG